jgi:predicted flap endonuclease-1-like 5' DNA nuclease
MFDLSTAITEALVLMIVAAILGGIIVWLLLRNQLETAQGQQTRAEAENARLRQQASGDQQAMQTLRTQLDACQGERQKFAAQLASATSSSTRSMTPEPAGKEAEALARVQARAKDIDFGRIGSATAAEKDDLKTIKGIGPFIEKKLNALQIFTFRQIANFSPEDEQTVNEAIEFFSGRIRRDDWKGQAAELAEGKK